MSIYAKVIVDIANTNVDRIFEYRVPDGINVFIGGRVRVPFRSSLIEGCVLGLTKKPDYDISKIKDIVELIDEEPILTEEQVKLAQLIKSEYRTTLAFALRLMYPAAMRGQRVKEKKIMMAALNQDADVEALKRQCYAKNGALKAKNRLRTIETLEKGEAPLSILDRAAVKKLIEMGAASEFLKEEHRTPYLGLKEPKRKEFALNDEQKNAVDRITKRVEEGEKQTILLHGVTGSGKTAVYIESIKRTLEMGKTALVLVPEISLTPQLYSILYSYFKDDIAVFHSGLSDGEKYDEWRRILNGEARIVVGARSAVFMPLKDLGLIIIDEEHEPSYRADNHPPYHAADIARWRSALNSCVLVLASATPRVESYARADIGMYELISMPHRVRGLNMPEMCVVDMRNEILLGNERTISGKLYKEMKNTLDSANQVMLFLNRRGYAASVQCLKCGAVEMCENCDIPLKLHRQNGKDVLMCHYCGRIYAFQGRCKACGSRFVRTVGSGTQKVEDEINELFPDARILRMDFDTTRKKDSHRRIYECFKDGGADILIGTQMIARGLDFDGVTLAAIINADTMLTYGDYRAEERTFSMIEQVGGRAGRKKPGKVIIQTYDPSNYAIQFALNHDYIGMFHKEMEERRRLIKPPFSTIYRFVFTSKSESMAQALCLEVQKRVNALINGVKNDILLFVAKPAPIDKLDGQSRYHIVLKVIKNSSTKFLRASLYDIWEKIKKRGVTVLLDVDPFDIN